MSEVVKPPIEDIEEAMKDVVDPELGINVVDLGLVYDIRVEGDNTATLDMTLTSAASARFTSVLSVMPSLPRQPSRRRCPRPRVPRRP